MEQNILYSMGKEGASNLVTLLSESLEPVVDMHNNDCVICSCGCTSTFLQLKTLHYICISWVHCDIDLGDTTLGHNKVMTHHIVENIIQIQHCNKKLCPRDGFLVCVHYDIDLRDLTWVNVMTNPWVMDNSCVKYFKIKHCSIELWPGHGFWGLVHGDFDSGDMTLSQNHETPWVMDNNCVKYFLDPVWQ